MTSEPDLTPAAQHLAERWARLQDVIGRCTRAIEEGNWVYLNDEAGELSLIADELSDAAAAITRDETATDPAALLAYAESLTEPGDES